MKNIKELFDYLNDVNFKYVVLRNWDGLPHSVELGQHSDLDLLVYDIDHFLEVIDEAKPEYDRPRVRHKLKVADSFIFMDIRHVGDGYYPKDFENSILESRELHPNGFYTPNPSMHRIALAYHAVHHKGGIARDYKRFLGEATLDDLLSALKESPIGWSQPDDPTVGTYNAYWKGATSIVSNHENIINKTQLAYKEYPLLENESQILKNITNPHFPKIIGLSTDGLKIENCGETLGVGNLPNDWKKQINGILDALDTHNIKHRDIRPDNLMVKDGVIKLIDFGWAVNENTVDKIKNTPPSCLGYGYRPSDGFDDRFSMRKVVKEIEYKLEEMEIT